MAEQVGPRGGRPRFVCNFLEEFVLPQPRFAFGRFIRVSKWTKMRKDHKDPSFKRAHEVREAQDEHNVDRGFLGRRRDRFMPIRAVHSPDTLPGGSFEYVKHYTRAYMHSHSWRYTGLRREVRQAPGPAGGPLPRGSHAV